eukprot:GHVT01081091.1.p1 GENE.GHVT01081091.1~~GHVT01081091.1.p1  ORF type:complete len:805 (+),score=109.84 GHVT01081091.1:1033-3447(+)
MPPPANASASAASPPAPCDGPAIEAGGASALNNGEAAAAPASFSTFSRQLPGVSAGAPPAPLDSVAAAPEASRSPGRPSATEERLALALSKLAGEHSFTFQSASNNNDTARQPPPSTPSHSFDSAARLDPESVEGEDRFAVPPLGDGAVRILHRRNSHGDDGEMASGRRSHSLTDQAAEFIENHVSCTSVELAHWHDGPQHWLVTGEDIQHEILSQAGMSPLSSRSSLGSAPAGSTPSLTPRSLSMFGLFEGKSGPRPVASMAESSPSNSQPTPSTPGSRTSAFKHVDKHVDNSSKTLTETQRLRGDLRMPLLNQSIAGSSSAPPSSSASMFSSVVVPKFVGPVGFSPPCSHEGVSSTPDEKSLSRDWITHSAAQSPVASTLATCSVISTSANIPLLSRMEAGFNLVNGVVGVGVLSIPFAFSATGLSTIFICIALTCFYCYTGILIARSLSQVNKEARSLQIPRLARDWQLLGWLTYGHVGQVASALSLTGELWCVLIAYLVIAGTSVEHLIPSISRTTAIIGCGLFAMFLRVFPVRAIVWISFLANLSTLVAITTFIISAAMLPDPAHLSELKIFDVSGLTTTMGIFNFCFVAHATFPTIYQSMRNPKADFNSSLVVSYIVAFITYASCGLFGYIRFGPDICNPYSANLGRDRQLRPLGGHLASLMPVCTQIAIVAKLEGQFPLYVTPILLSLSKIFGIDHAPWLVRRVWPSAFIAVTIGVALLVQNSIGDFQSLTGCLFVTMTCLILPVLFYLKLCSDGISTLERTCLYVVVGFGVAMQISGTATSLLGMYRTVRGLDRLR